LLYLSFLPLRSVWLLAQVLKKQPQKQLKQPQKLLLKLLTLLLLLQTLLLLLQTLLLLLQTLLLLHLLQTLRKKLRSNIRAF
jgi:hypothetical protein